MDMYKRETDVNRKAKEQTKNEGIKTEKGNKVWQI